jgi:phosphoglycolate phosphatase
MIKACIFDLDGTLLNTLDTITHYVNATLAELGFTPISEAECCSFIGCGARHLIDCALKSKGASDTALLDRTLKAYNAKYDSDTLYLTRPYDGVVDMIDGLFASGIRLAVLSNKPDATTVDIIERFFPGRFAIAHGGRAGVPLKPDPTALIMTMEELGVSPDETMYIGDTGVDVATGKRAGVYKTVGVSWGYRPVAELVEYGADVIIDHPGDILTEAQKI